jgi:serine/threonine-protein kinase HipA
MNRRIQVCIGEAKEPVGTLLYETSGNRESCSFAYHPEWLVSPKRFALSPDLPLQAGMMFHPRTRDGSTFFDCIADTEPDGWGKRVILRDHTKRRKQSLQQGLAPNTQPLNALDYLLAVDDISRVGALRFLDESGIPQRSHHDAERGTPPLIDLGKIYRASLAVEQEKETAADLAYLRGKGTSLGGMRPKCTVIDHDGSLCLGKFPSIGDDRAVTKGEILALALANAAGINAAKGRVEMVEDTPVALIRRFDREAGGRILYVSARTMLSAKPDEDHSYTEIVDVIRKVSPHAKQDMAELWRRMVFNILITNVDDHLNNHGFLHRSHGQWVLSPAFDLNPFPDKQRELKTWISEDSGPSGSIRDCLAVARYFGLDKADTTRILKEVTTPVKNWCNLATKVGMSGTERDKFEPAFEHGELEQALSAT